MVEIINRLKDHVFHPLHHQLRDALTTLNAEILGWISVDEEHLEFSAVPTVDKARCVEASHTMLQRQTTTWLNEPGVTLRDRHRKSGRNEFASSARAQYRFVASREIKSGVTDTRIGGQRKIRVESHHRNFEHRGIVEGNVGSLRARLDGS